MDTSRHQDHDLHAASPQDAAAEDAAAAAQNYYHDSGTTKRFPHAVSIEFFSKGNLIAFAADSEEVGCETFADLSHDLSRKAHAIVRYMVAKGPMDAAQAEHLFQDSNEVENQMLGAVDFLLEWAGALHGISKQTTKYAPGK